jgi:predicted Zn-dependent protease with MMP-like domain
MKRDEFVKVAEEVLDSLPEEFRSRIENVAILVEDFPPKQSSRRGQQRQLLLGIFHGVPATKKSVFDLSVGPAHIVLYQKNIEAVCLSEAEVRQQIRQTLIHELGHYFGMTEVLVRHTKEVVTKDDLMKEVWPDTFVEEANLSRHIFMLRKALGENSPEQRYILTVPGRGYRLAESVRLVPEQDLSIIAAQHSKIQVQIAETKAWRWQAVAVGLALAASAVATWIFLHRPAVLTEKDTVILGEFTNSTGDPAFDGTLRQGLIVQLEQSPFLSLVSEQRIHHTLQLMGKPGDGPLTEEAARQVCARTGSAAVIEASIAPLGNHYAGSSRHELSSGRCSGH